MKTKDFAYIGIIVLLLLLALFKGHSDNKALDKLHSSNKALEDSISVQMNTISWLNKAQIENIHQIQTLQDSLNNNQLKYKTIYEKYYIKDSVANSLSINDIQQFFSKRYNN